MSHEGEIASYAIHSNETPNERPGMLVSLHVIAAMEMILGPSANTAYLKREKLHLKLARVKGSKLLAFNVASFPTDFDQIPHHDWDRILRRMDSIHAGQSRAWEWCRRANGTPYIRHRERHEIEYDVPDVWFEWHENVLGVSLDEEIEMDNPSKDELDDMLDPAAPEFTARMHYQQPRVPPPPVNPVGLSCNISYQYIL